MHRPRHCPRRSARLYLSLLSVLALVAFACVPAFAQAECTDSSCAQYEVEIPTAGGKTKKSSGKTGSETEPQAEASNKVGNAGGQSAGGDKSSEETEEGMGVAPGKDNGGGNPGGKDSARGGDATGGKEGVESGQAVEGPTQQGQAASSSGDGGSSPLVPILIAVAVLAAISIGAVIYRQRRQSSGGSGSPVSPNA